MSPPPPEKGKAQVPHDEQSKGNDESNRNGLPDATDNSPEAEAAGPDLSVFDPEFVSVESQQPEFGQSESAQSPTTEIEEQYRRPRFEDIVPHSSDSEAMATPQASNASTLSETPVKDEDSSNEEGSSSTHDEDPDGNEDPSKTVQRMMVDSVMTSFMDWLDVKLKVKGEEEKADLSIPGRYLVNCNIELSFIPGRAQETPTFIKTSGYTVCAEKPFFEDEVSGAKLACPFFKHNPRKYKNQRPCCGPGWDHVHRIKEHIYRKHSLPKFSCPRCSQPFETQADLQAHARLPTPCEVKETEVLDGITQDQEKKLRSRKKTSGKELTEAEKWTQVYSILFPDVREREIPSPYYNTEDAQTNLGGYEDYLRRELPTQVRRQLEKEVEQQLSFVEEGMKQKVIEIARNLQLSLFKSYQQIETQERDTEGPSPSAGYISSSDFVSFTATDTSPSTMTTAGTTPEMPDPLEIFGGDPAIPDFNFDFLSQDPSAQSQGPEKSSDPAFGIDPYATSGPPTIQPGMEMFGGQQFGMPYYDMEGYDERQGTVRDMSVLSYAP
ncbi:hypothetical protein K4K60_002528 [Colletotrichum sp. SAR11_57]|nr:hypothetical protein K4K60_002528 [Colletotrichum sp. SAR11_57]